VRNKPLPVVRGTRASAAVALLRAAGVRFSDRPIPGVARSTAHRLLQRAALPYLAVQDAHRPTGQALPSTSPFRTSTQDLKCTARSGVAARRVGGDVPPDVLEGTAHGYRLRRVHNVLRSATGGMLLPAHCTPGQGATRRTVAEQLNGLVPRDLRSHGRPRSSGPPAQATGPSARGTPPTRGERTGIVAGRWLRRTAQAGRGWGRGRGTSVRYSRADAPELAKVVGGGHRASVILVFGQVAGAVLPVRCTRRKSVTSSSSLRVVRQSWSMACSCRSKRRTTPVAGARPAPSRSAVGASGSLRGRSSRRACSRSRNAGHRRGVQAACRATALRAERTVQRDQLQAVQVDVLEFPMRADRWLSSDNWLRSSEATPSAPSRPTPRRAASRSQFYGLHMISSSYDLIRTSYPVGCLSAEGAPDDRDHRRTGVSGAPCDQLARGCAVRAVTRTPTHGFPLRRRGAGDPGKPPRGSALPVPHAVLIQSRRRRGRRTGRARRDLGRAQGVALARPTSTDPDADSHRLARPEPEASTRPSTAAWSGPAAAEQLP